MVMSRSVDVPLGNNFHEWFYRAGCGGQSPDPSRREPVGAAGHPLLMHYRWLPGATTSLARGLLLTAVTPGASWGTGSDVSRSSSCSPRCPLPPPLPTGDQWM